MENQKIAYDKIIELGFEEEECEDKIYFQQYGYKYCIITLNLTKKIHLEWAKETQLCEMVRIDHPDTGNVMKRMQISGLRHLLEIINFYTDR